MDNTLVTIVRSWVPVRVLSIAAAAFPGGASTPGTAAADGVCVGPRELVFGPDAEIAYGLGSAWNLGPGHVGLLGIASVYLDLEEGPQTRAWIWARESGDEGRTWGPNAALTDTSSCRVATSLRSYARDAEYYVCWQCVRGASPEIEGWWVSRWAGGQASVAGAVRIDIPGAIAGLATTEKNGTALGVIGPDRRSLGLLAGPDLDDLEPAGPVYESEVVVTYSNLIAIEGTVAWAFTDGSRLGVFSVAPSTRATTLNLSDFDPPVGLSPRLFKSARRGLCLAYTLNESDERDVLVRCSDDAGRSWSSAQKALRSTSPSLSYYRAEVRETASGRWIATSMWDEAFTLSPGVAMASSEDGGYSWSDPMHLERPIEGVPHMALAGTGAIVVASLRGGVDGPLGVLRRIHTDGYCNDGVASPVVRDGLLRVSVLRPERLAVAVYDVVGRRQWHRELGTVGPGLHEIPVGAGLAPGVYFVAVHSDLIDRSTQRLVVVR
jgi:hypothetical protein